MKSRIIFMGSPDFAVPSLETLLRGNYEIVAVFTQPDRESGRGKRMTPTRIKEIATIKGLEIFQPEKLKNKDIVGCVTNLKPHLIVVAAYGHLIPPEILAIPEYGCLAVHPSLLPRHRGSSPVAAAILNGDEKTGVTIMLMNKEFDKGPMLLKREITIQQEDTTGSLNESLAKLGATLLKEAIPRWIGGKIVPQPQDEAKANYTRIITKEEGKIGWNFTALDLWRRIRAYDPWPGCYTSWLGKRLKIIKAIPLVGGITEPAGKVIPLSEGEAEVGIVTREGILGLIEIQLEGKRAMSAGEFVRGHNSFPGSILP